MAFSTAGGGPSRPEMNVTPLIDVLLVLIIFFMVIVSMSHTTGEKAQIPQPADGPEKPSTLEGTIVIQVIWSAEQSAPAFKINDEHVSAQDLEPRLHDIFKARADKVAFVQGDDDVDFEVVADVIASAREAGVDRVGLLGKNANLAHGS